MSRLAFWFLSAGASVGHHPADLLEEKKRVSFAFPFSLHCFWSGFRVVEALLRELMGPGTARRGRRYEAYIFIVLRCGHTLY